MLQRVPRADLRVACTALTLLVAACIDFGLDDPEPEPTAQAWVWIDPADSKVDTASVSLGGEAECPGCPMSDWQYQVCPELTCPDTGIDVIWTNVTTGATGPATHGEFADCHCPIFQYGYCYSACNHFWWATVPLVYGENRVEVSASGSGRATGMASTAVGRVPVPPAWAGIQPGPGSVTLNWQPVANATSYNVYWSTTAYIYASLCTKIEGVTAPFLHAGLASGTPHYYFVTALVGDAESFDSQRLMATPQ